MGEEVRLADRACGHPATISIGQSVIGGQLRWYRTVSCPSCPAIEEDGVGLPSALARRELIAANGRWKLLVTSDAPAAIKLLRIELGWSMGEAATALHQLPVVYIGTRTEAEWLRDKLTAAGVPAQIEREPKT